MTDLIATLACDSSAYSKVLVLLLYLCATVLCTWWAKKPDLFER